MKLQTKVLSVAILSALAIPALLPATGNATSSAALRARALADGRAAALVRRADADAFIPRATLIDANGTEHVRFDRTYRGLPVIGGDFVMHSRNGRVEGVSQTLRTTARPAVVPKVGKSRAITEAGARFGTHFTGTPQSRLVIYARGGIAPRLAHEVTFRGFRRDQTPTEMHYFVDAANGRILGQFDNVQTIGPGPNQPCKGTAATGTGKTQTLGDVRIDTSKCGASYQLTDLRRGGGRTQNMAQRTTGFGLPLNDADNVWGNGTTRNVGTAAAEAHYGVATTWDYFRNVHGRNGIANDGRGALSRVHYGRNFANAFWSDACFCMTFGDGDNGASAYPLTVLDVSGHEMSHGVTSRSANLIYEGESGGLNEATSDIFGTMVEYYAGNAKDPGDYILGEKIYVANASLPAGAIPAAIRYMFKPSLDGASPDCYSPDLGELDVHYSSGVANHFYYLLAEGAVVPSGFGAGTEADLTPADLVCGGSTALKGIGRGAAQKIWYRALTVYMTSDTDYAAARAATIRAANDLYGASSTQARAVAAAWTAVGVS